MNIGQVMLYGLIYEVVLDLGTVHVLDDAAFGSKASRDRMWSFGVEA